MKTVILALLVLVVVSQSEALRCYCGGRKICSSSVETCSGSNMVCASVIFERPSPSYFKSCLKSSDCRILNQPGIASAYCCRTDLCNR